ncbi:MAG: 4-hydroxy-tetrahydrodipicolinate reductase [Elusimicrobia bacterium]|nr:4-hydroxy-tetrahydrodipicolinate reductase [Elusimicrobiota bacterium]
MVQKAIRLVIHGAGGRMGSRTAALAATDARFELAACVFHRVAGESRGARAFLAEDLPKALSGADVLVDFSAAGASVSALEAAALAKKAAVVGTTGFSSVQRAQIQALSKRIPVFLSPNFSRGVAVLGRLAREMARLLPAYDAAILETHHKAKKDAPSGTALRLAQALREARPDQAQVPISSQRLGGVVGEHAITFAGPFERIEIVHRADSRALFALGALDAAAWLRRKRPGLYGMDDWLGAK